MLKTPVSEAQIDKRKKEQKKLESDLREYEILKAGLEKTQEATKKITGKLS